ncbi:MAG TPA: hypothetical protein VFV87_22880, partial [Pirellulaceae bacterium]|nr:hypothetical protein [Pirellulaceae bacterium]
MAIPFQCHQCGGQFAAPDQLAGKKAKCQRCGAVVEVPAATYAGAGLTTLGPATGGQMPSADPLANPLAHAAANPYGAQVANPYGPQAAGAYPQQDGGAHLQPAVAATGNEIPWGWIIGGGGAVIVVAGLIGVVMMVWS